MSDLRAVLTDIYTQRGELTPEVVVEAARPKNSPLHDRFEWDNNIAGEAYRRVQAGRLIRSVQIEYDQTERKFVRAFSSVRRTDPEKQGYKPTEEILADPFATKVLLQECERAIADMKRKYGHLTDFAELVRQAVA